MKHSGSITSDAPPLTASRTREICGNDDDDNNDRPKYISAVGSYTPTMAEFPASLLVAPSPFAAGLVVDSRAACAHEAGEIIAAGEQLGREVEMVELGELMHWRALAVDRFQQMNTTKS